MRRVTGILIAILLTLIFLYLSRFWIWQAPWGNDGLFGIKALSPRGNVLRQLIPIKSLAVFDILIWFAVVIFTLSGLQWLKTRIAK